MWVECGVVQRWCRHVQAECWWILRHSAEPPQQLAETGRVLVESDEWRFRTEKTALRWSRGRELLWRVRADSGGYARSRASPHRVLAEY